MENSFEIGEIVLGKVKGYPYWPGIITRKKGKSPKTVYTIKFFGDHSFSALKKKYIKKYQMDFVDKKLLESNINMKQSIEEAEDALLFLVQEKNTKNQINIEIEVDFNYNYKVYNNEDLRYIYPNSTTLVKNDGKPDYESADYHLYELIVFENLK